MIELDDTELIATVEIVVNFEDRQERWGPVPPFMAEIIAGGLQVDPPPGFVSVTLDELPEETGLDRAAQKDDDDHYYGAWIGGKASAGGHPAGASGGDGAPKAVDFPGLTGGWKSKKLEAAVIDAEKEVDKARGGEICLALASDGTVINRKAQQGKEGNGGYTAGSYTDGELRTLAESTLIHNHPMGYDYPDWDPRSFGNSLSGADMSLAASANLHEIRAVGPKATYILRRDPNKTDWGDPKLVDLQIQFAEMEVRGDFMERIVRRTDKAWGATMAEREAHAEAEHWNEVVTRVANAEGWQYEVIPR